MMVRPPPARIYLHKFTSDPDRVAVYCGSGAQPDPEFGRIRNPVGSGTRSDSELGRIRNLDGSGTPSDPELLARSDQDPV